MHGGQGGYSLEFWLPILIDTSRGVPQSVEAKKLHAVTHRHVVLQGPAVFGDLTCSAEKFGILSAQSVSCVGPHWTDHLLQGCVAGDNMLNKKVFAVLKVKGFAKAALGSSSGRKDKKRFLSNEYQSQHIKQGLHITDGTSKHCDVPGQLV